MAAKKFYAVKVGKETGIFDNWDDCKASVSGFPGAEYKGFPSKEEAIAYLGSSYSENEGKASGKGDKRERQMKVEDYLKNPKLDHVTEADVVVAYVDGSYDDQLKKYAFGCVFLLPDGYICTECGNGDNPDSLKQRNVTGEMLGAMFAVQATIFNGFKQVDIYYDYEGIEKWVTGAWKAKNELTQKYSTYMRGQANKVKITFHKVAAHTNVMYNEMADQMAKKGLRAANGVPKVRKFEEMPLDVD